MILIKINKKLLKATLASALLISLSFNIYSHIRNVELTNKYESLVCISSQFYQTELITFITSMQQVDTAEKVVEIFDITKGEVVRKVQPTSSIHKLAVSYLNGISGMYAKVKAFPDKGYIIRIPLRPAVEAQTHWLKDFNINSVDEVFILYPEQGNPFLMVLDDKARPIFYNFKGDANLLLQILEFKF